MIDFLVFKTFLNCDKGSVMSKLVIFFVGLIILVSQNIYAHSFCYSCTKETLIKPNHFTDDYWDLVHNIEFPKFSDPVAYYVEFSGKNNLFFVPIRGRPEKRTYFHQGTYGNAQTDILEFSFGTKWLRGRSLKKPRSSFIVVGTSGIIGDEKSLFKTIIAGLKSKRKLFAICNQLTRDTRNEGIAILRLK